jgi:hypothetical protein
VIHDLHEADTAAVGTDTWGGSLTGPGHTFDLTPPTLSGLVDKTVRARRGAKRVRVRYRVTARDLKDGSVPARCKPARAAVSRSAHGRQAHRDGYQREHFRQLQSRREAPH